MSASGLSLPDAVELTEGLSSLICETNIEKQIINIENWLKSYLPIKATALSIFVPDRHKQEKMRLLNPYETVSSSLSFTGDLQELLTMIISIVVSELPSEEGSILLYDDETNELEFFSVMGETGVGLVQCRFPAGKALQDGQAVIVNDVQTCPYFFSDIDNESGFVTKSIVAAPIVTGGERSASSKPSTR